jgi:hypothetical protein
MSNSLSAELASLAPELKSRLLARGFREERLLEQAAGIGVNRDERNRLPSGVEPPLDSDLAQAADETHPRFQEWSERGKALLREGKVALVVLAGVAVDTLTRGSRTAAQRSPRTPSAAPPAGGSPR